jgi:hypothetical protein
MALFGTVSPDKPLTGRNLLINGDMQIAQRNTSVTGITTGEYRTADRWYFFVSSAGTWTMNVESSAPTGTEFRNSSNVICTTADSSLSAGDELAIIQNIEGFNCQGIKKGTANAESITVSFWAKSSNTGTFICELRDEDNTRQISKSYTINTSGTWERKTITFPPDTTGQFGNDNGSSLRLFMWLAAGSNFSSGTLNSSAWASSTNANRVVGQLNLANAVGNYLAITGVQLEIGTVATPYEQLPYQIELALCQRYFQKNMSAIGGAGSSTECAVTIPIVPTMRASPSLTLLNGTNAIDELYTSRRTITALNTVWGENEVGTSIGITLTTSGLTTQRMTTLFSGRISLNAEL